MLVATLQLAKDSLDSLPEMQSEMEASSSLTYVGCTTRKIASLDKLKPGDHIIAKKRLMLRILSYDHHMLVVEVVNTEIVAIYKKRKASGVVEGTVDYGADKITVLDYDCPYTGQEAIARARERMDQSYKLLTSNCEHFVTEARTGQEQSIQVQKVEKRARVAGAFAVGIRVAAALVVGPAYVTTRKGKYKRISDSDMENA